VSEGSVAGGDHQRRQRLHRHGGAVTSALGPLVTALAVDGDASVVNLAGGTINARPATPC